MSAANNGGPAFPHTVKYKDISHIKPGEIGIAQDVEITSAGMTLRDYFAAKAMQGLLASGHYEGKVELMPLAFSAYAVASAMLAEREKGGAK